jgi:hypothetical protein
MKKSHLINALLFVFLNFFTVTAFAWCHSIEVGYGRSQDPNASRYTNSGFMVSGDIIPLLRTNWSFWSINADAGRWFTTAPHNKTLTTAAAVVALRLYPFIPIAHCYPAYLFGSLGPAYLSNKKFGMNRQAEHLTLQTNLGAGIEFHPIDVNLRLVHYSNANLGTPNQGFNILYLLSVGYLF